MGGGLIGLVGLTLTTYADLERLAADTIIDVRSPSEFAEDQLPGAINLPVLSDAERARVGTIYKQDSPFLARKIGAALVARNSALHLEGPLSKMSGGWRPVVYCWRGGQRSGAFATILSQIGWRAEVIEGGYRAYRRTVSEMLYDAPFRVPIVLLDGNTGTAKTELLVRLADKGFQTLDLEAMANHRGSLFGWVGEQPSQRRFESIVAQAIAGLDADRPVIIEAESPKIGRLSLPPSLLKPMRAAPRIIVDAPLQARADYLVRTYQEIALDRTRLASVIEKLRPMHSAERISGWQSMAREGKLVSLAAELMAKHYDPRYDKMRARHGGPSCTLTASALDDAALARLADGVAGRLDAQAWQERCLVESD